MAKVKVSVELVRAEASQTRVLWEKDLTRQFSLNECPSFKNATNKQSQAKQSVVFDLINNRHGIAAVIMQTGSYTLYHDFFFLA